VPGQGQGQARHRECQTNPTQHDACDSKILSGLFVSFELPQGNVPEDDRKD
jgi:hypothetical protein